MNSTKPKRYTEGLKCVLSYLASSATGKPIMWGMPFTAGIELTNHCNLSCPECASGSGEMKRGKGFMSISLFEKIVREADSHLLHANLYFQGEPMMHPAFFQLLDIASSFRTTVSTNGHFLEGENAEKLATSSLGKLIVSIDGTDSRTYNLYRKNGDLGKVIRGIRQVSDAVRKLHSSLKIEMQFLVSRHNESQIGGAGKLAGELGVSLRLKSMQVIHPEMNDYWMPVNERFRRYRFEDGRFRIKSSLGNRCSRLWFNPVITWNGLVVPCCFDKDAEHIMGDMNVNSLREIWYGEKYTELQEISSKGPAEILRSAGTVQPDSEG